MNQPAKSVCYENEFFRIQHCGDCFVAGHLIVYPKKDVLKMSEMAKEVQESLGKTIAIAHGIIVETVQPERIYTLSFCEILPSLHYHLFPRTKVMALAYAVEHHHQSSGINGALMFDWARNEYREACAEDYFELVDKINELFKKNSVPR